MIGTLRLKRLVQSDEKTGLLRSREDWKVKIDRVSHKIAVGRLKSFRYKIARLNNLRDSHCFIRIQVRSSTRPEAGLALEVSDFV